MSHSGTIRSVGIPSGFLLNTLLRWFVTNPVKSYQEQYLCCSLGPALSKLSISGLSVLMMLDMQDRAALTSLQGRPGASLTHGRAGTSLKAVCPLQMFSSGQREKHK